MELFIINYLGTKFKQNKYNVQQSLKYSFFINDLYIFSLIFTCDDIYYQTTSFIRT
jgi:hypothetical protein